jgi:hypothetical protein
LLQYKFVCSQMTTYDASWTALVSLFNHFNICILTLPLHSYHINSNFCIFLRRMHPWEWPKKTETCSRTATCWYIYIHTHTHTVGHNESAVVAVRLVTDDSKVTLFPLGQWYLFNYRYIK